MKRSVPLAALAVLVLLAGCNGGFGITESAQSPTPDAPAETPPGLSASNVTDGFALADAHADALAGANFTVRGRHTLTAANGTRLVNATAVRQVAADHDRVATQRTFDGARERPFETPVDRVDSWSNESHLHYRLSGPNGTEYTVSNVSGGRVDVVDPTGRRTLQSYYLHAESSTVAAVDGSIELRLTLSPDVNASATPPVDVTERTATVTMTESGRVERYRVEYTGRLRNAPDTTVEGVRVVEFGALGETAVERPAWIPAARNATADP